MVQRTDAPDPSTFPQQPRWATWIRDRRSGQFKLHNHLGLAKNAVAGRHMPRGISRPVPGGGGPWDTEYPLEGGYVYEWVSDDNGEGWELRFTINPGDFKSDHPLWEFKEAKRKVRPVSQKAIDAAIASIQQD